MNFFGEQKKVLHMKKTLIPVVLAGVVMASFSGCRLKSEDGKPVETFTQTLAPEMELIETETTEAAANPNTLSPEQIEKAKETSSETTTETTSTSDASDASIDSNDETDSDHKTIIRNSYSPEPGTNEMVDYLARKGRSDALIATDDQLQEAVDFLKNNTHAYFSGEENMEYTMYYGFLLEAYYSGTGNAYERIGFQAYKTVKYVYRGVDSVLDDVTHNNLLKLQKMAESLPDIK